MKEIVAESKKWICYTLSEGGLKDKKASTTLSLSLSSPFRDSLSLFPSFVTFPCLTPCPDCNDSGTTIAETVHVYV